uniref:Small RNA 2'-O-methyltransferase Hen1 La-motif C-terminal domain-containing protein n=1 Tax=Salix viminalis TaxID=40686 RepID=A0A6N2LFY3_SALVM
MSLCVRVVQYLYILSHTVEEVKEDSAQNGCPGLAIPQKGPSLFRCRLELPEFTVVSDICKKKKDAEQSAAGFGFKNGYFGCLNLGNNPADENPSEKDPCDALIARIKYLFTDEVVALRAALQRKGGLYGLVPASVIAACDTKTSNLCKLLNTEVESKPFLALSLIMRAIPRLSGFVVTSKGSFSIQKQNPYPTEIIDNTNPASLDETIQPVTLDISSSGYYLDVIAQKLGCNRLPARFCSQGQLVKLLLRQDCIFAASESLVMELLSDHANVKDFHVKGLLNARASYFCGQEIYGDAIMASVDTHGGNYKKQSELSRCFSASFSCKCICKDLGRLEKLNVLSRIDN